MLLVVDNMSSYWSDLIRCIDSIGARHEVRRYDRLDCDIRDYDGIILSGRANNIKPMNVANMRLVRLAYENSKPLLGICYGAEIMALAFGGSIRRLGDRIAGEQTVNVRATNPLTDKKTLRVLESHGYSIARLPEAFSVIADSGNCEFEMIAHEKQRLFGTQFHPEASRDGLEIIANFAKLIGC